MVNTPATALLVNGASKVEKMETTCKITALVVFAFVSHGCAVTPVSPTAQNVNVISEQQAKSCRFLDNVSTNNGNTLSQNPEQEARNRALNRVAELGGNSLRIVSTNTQIAPSGIGSIFSLSGEAYICK
jgi:hypothetical protein